MKNISKLMFFTFYWSMLFVSCNIAKDQIKFAELDIQKVTIQKFIPGENDQEEYWKLNIPCNNLLIHSAYYNNFSGYINENKNKNCTGNLLMNKIKVSSKIKKLISNNQLVIAINKSEHIEYLMVKEFKILEPIYLPVSEKND